MFKEIEPYKEYLSSIRKWTEFVKEHPELNLPTASALIYKFGSWSKAKSYFGYLRPVTITYMSKATIIGLLEPYKHHLSTAAMWDEFVKEHEELRLPNYQSIIQCFQSWNKMKKAMNLPVHPSNRPSVYTREEIIQIVRSYAPHSFSPRKWERFRKEQEDIKLPSFQTITKNLSREEREELQREYEDQILP